MADKPASANVVPPSPRPGFESDLLREVEGLVTSLPKGVARLRVSRIAGHPHCKEPDFDVRPANPKAARFGGYAIGTDLYLNIGEAGREFIGFARGSNIVSGATWQEELRWIWQAVIAGGFTQRHYLDARGKVIAWAARLMVNGKDVVFRNGRRESYLGERIRERKSSRTSPMRQHRERARARSSRASHSLGFPLCGLLLALLLSHASVPIRPRADP
jgi:hypothetical protein